MKLHEAFKYEQHAINIKNEVIAAYQLIGIYEKITLVDGEDIEVFDDVFAVQGDEWYPAIYYNPELIVSMPYPVRAYVAWLRMKLQHLEDINRHAEASFQIEVSDNNEIMQLLGAALGYPWFKDDARNFPNATVEDGVCVGEHVPVTLAAEAADRINKLSSNLVGEEFKEPESLSEQLFWYKSGNKLRLCSGMPSYGCFRFAGPLELDIDFI